MELQNHGFGNHPFPAAERQRSSQLRIDAARALRHGRAMEILSNPYCGAGLDIEVLRNVPFPSVDPTRPLAWLDRHPKAAETPLQRPAGLARDLGIAELLLKDERGRMGLGSFKALGAAYVIACDAEDGNARGRTYITASAGNHGLSVAAGAAMEGAKAIVYIAEPVPEAFAERLRAQGAEVVRAGATYEASMQAAAEAAEAGGAVLLSDSSWPGYTARPHRLMEGYLAMMAEAHAQIGPAPSHIFLQAGVGGLAGAAAAYARKVWGDTPRIIVVEPEAAPALIASVRAGAPVVSQGPVSDMGRLDCKEPSLIALKGLARDANEFLTISEAQGHSGAALADAQGFATTPSGAAGLASLAALDAKARGALGIDDNARVMVILSEGPEA